MEFNKRAFSEKKIRLHILENEIKQKSWLVVMHIMTSETVPTFRVI